MTRSTSPSTCRPVRRSWVPTLDWAETNYDMDLYVYDPTGRLAKSSTNGDVNHEDVSITSSADPMMPNAGLPAGEWTVEVRGWLVVAPEPFNGTFSVTAAQ